jgi:hypothetical protein
VWRVVAPRERKRGWKLRADSAARRIHLGCGGFVVAGLADWMPAGVRAIAGGATGVRATREADITAERLKAEPGASKPAGAPAAPGYYLNACC